MSLMMQYLMENHRDKEIAHFNVIESLILASNIKDFSWIQRVLSTFRSNHFHELNNIK